jgi:heme A synthase
MAAGSVLKPETSKPAVRRVAQLAWLTLLYNVGVIVWGAYVRATGAGAGCGNHWPLCNGEAIPRGARLETLVEFSHRASSGLAALLVGGLLVVCWWLLPKRHPARRASLLAVLLMVTEALLGAALVKFQLVAQDRSLARALSLPIHSTNTMLLLAAIALTACWVSLDPVALRPHWGNASLALTGLVTILVTTAAGAIAALGDTLFPHATMVQDFSAGSHFLLRLRVLHPALALATAVMLALLVVRARRQGARARRWAGLVGVAMGCQVFLGVLNLALQAPVWLQMLHLAVADAVWIGAVLLTAETVLSPAISGTAEAQPT